MLTDRAHHGFAGRKSAFRAKGRPNRKKIAQNQDKQGPNRFDWTGSALKSFFALNSGLSGMAPCAGPLGMS
jgi:hypothetical protein